MNLEKMLADLRSERDRLDQAISALEGLSANTGRSAGAGAGRKQQQAATTGKRRGRRRLSPEARKRMSQLMKQRWAERKKRAA